MASSMDFDLILMDLQMPVMDGLKATKYIRKTNTSTPIVALTANVQAEDRDRCEAVGMNAFLSKPLSKRELISVLVEHGLCEET